MIVDIRKKDNTVIYEKENVLFNIILHVEREKGGKEIDYVDVIAFDELLDEKIVVLEEKLKKISGKQIAITVFKGRFNPGQAYMVIKAIDDNPENNDSTNEVEWDTMEKIISSSTDYIGSHLPLWKTYHFTDGRIIMK